MLNLFQHLFYSWATHKTLKQAQGDGECEHCIITRHAELVSASYLKSGDKKNPEMKIHEHH